MTLSRFTHRRKKDEDLAEEIESHLAHEQDRNAARGLSPQEARRQAHLRFRKSCAQRVSAYGAIVPSPGWKIYGAICDSLCADSERHRDLPSSPFL